MSLNERGSIFNRTIEFYTDTNLHTYLSLMPIYFFNPTNAVIFLVSFCWQDYRQTICTYIYKECKAVKVSYEPRSVQIAEQASQEPGRATRIIFTFISRQLLLCRQYPPRPPWENVSRLIIICASLHITCYILMRFTMGALIKFHIRHIIS